ncbi:hypothetical protein QJQ45_006806 [Haematococcus lacustris]|nr:hypothetical protein QJQ45_006806 [Haematococcus lacustris]
MAIPASSPAMSLIALPTLVNEIASRAVQLGSGNELSLTCRAFSQANLLHAPALYVELERQYCDKQLTHRVVAALRNRTSKLAMFMRQMQKPGSGQCTELLTHALDKLGSCASVRACVMSSIKTKGSDSDSDSSATLHCSPGLAQRLVDNFPGLTALSLLGYSITCSGLASLLAHPQLSLQLQQLTLAGINILQPQQPGPGAVTLDNLFHGASLKRLHIAGITPAQLPNLQPLAQHMTQLQLRFSRPHLHDLDRLGLASLAGLQVLSIRGRPYLEGVPQLLQALPQLHTLHLPCTLVNGRQELDALLAATQLTKIQLLSMEGLAKPQAGAPCTWRQLQLTGRINCATAACLPLHSLTKPLELRAFFVSAKQDSNALVEAAVRNLSQAGRLHVKIDSLDLDFEGCGESQGEQAVQRLVAALSALHPCSRKEITFHQLSRMTTVTLPLLAPLCQGCSHLTFVCGSVDPSLEFWRQLMQAMPTVQGVFFASTRGTNSEAACAVLRKMAEQPWSRPLDILIRPWMDSCLPKHCMAIHREFGGAPFTRSIAKFTVAFYIHDHRSGYAPPGIPW